MHRRNKTQNFASFSYQIKKDSVGCLSRINMEHSVHTADLGDAPDSARGAVVRWACTLEGCTAESCTAGGCTPGDYNAENSAVDGWTAEVGEVVGSIAAVGRVGTVMGACIPVHDEKEGADTHAMEAGGTPVTGEAGMSSEEEPRMSTVVEAQSFLPAKK